MQRIQKDRKLSRRRRKKMAKVQQRKQRKGYRTVRRQRSAIYRHLVSGVSSIKILDHLGEGFERELFLASLNNLSDKGNPVRFNNFAYCMREIITLILAKYSSDEDVINCCWYKNETDKENGVTRAQRVKYSIQGGFSDKEVYQLLDLDEEDEKIIDETLKSFARRFRELNQHTHLRESRFNIGDDLCESLASEVLDVMSSILELIEDSRERVKEQLEGAIDETLISEFIESTFEELDILSTHTVVDYSELEFYHVDRISSEHVIISGQGTVHCDLQWGSGSDMRNGVGASMSESFPYEFSARSKLKDLQSLELCEAGITVGTDSWYE